MSFRQKLLFVCSKNQWRSPTAQKLFQNSDFYHARSAGTSDRARIKLTENLIDWADIILVMERKHLAIARQKYQQAISEKTVFVLDIPDDYQYMDAELIELLSDKISACLEIDRESF
jgi:predicted protein tyrosine phosphatase